MKKMLALCFMLNVGLIGFAQIPAFSELLKKSSTRVEDAQGNELTSKQKGS